jgi:chloramphenicol-sensitive protein RarD
VTHPQSQARAGMILGLTAYAVWGVLPLYFKALAAVGPVEIVAHRIVWSLVFLTLLAVLFRRWGAIGAAIAVPRLALTLLLTATLIGVNWTVYIYAVATGHVLEGSLGYYLNPLVNVLLGVAFLGERLNRVQVAAVALAGVGVAILAFGAGSALWISLTLAASFASYGFVRKVAPVDAFEGLYVETLFLAPAALAWIGWLAAHGQSSFHVTPRTDLLLVLGGAVTAIPLLLFTAAAKRLPLSTLGFLQYVAPSLQFLMAVAVFGEPLTGSHLFCFGLIWTALALFIVGGFRGSGDREALGAAASAR